MTEISVAIRSFVFLSLSIICYLMIEVWSFGKLKKKTGEATTSPAKVSLT